MRYRQCKLKVRSTITNILGWWSSRGKEFWFQRNFTFINFISSFGSLACHCNYFPIFQLYCAISWSNHVSDNPFGLTRYREFLKSTARHQTVSPGFSIHQQKERENNFFSVMPWRHVVIWLNQSAHFDVKDVVHPGFLKTLGFFVYNTTRCKKPLNWVLPSTRSLKIH